MNKPKPPQLRGVKLRRAVLDATIARVEAVGIDQVRIADVAVAAGVHETSIYRRWKTLARLLTDALVSRTAAEVPIPDTGSVRTDLAEFATALARFVATPTGTALVRGTVVADDDPEVTAMREEYWHHRLTASEQIVRRAQSRGEVAATADPRTVVLTLGGLVHIHATHLGREISAATITRSPPEVRGRPTPPRVWFLCRWGGGLKILPPWWVFFFGSSFFFFLFFFLRAAPAAPCPKSPPLPWVFIYRPLLFARPST
ncbi:TetR-like C-terminal domain-containing protein [Nocardia otitidiscaviarum]|uniref:TetR-like C-terminal domain-containing protein n=1 Tax=Nocardia otitidiscaviarum TaxID=1823 RepID=UPI0024578E26|nr:TetR-like C-terminal domain-containing protein [Nocardia otitidiscaviarum]